jgi:DNA-binding HxlR family transcriptional regulator
MIVTGDDTTSRDGPPVVPGMAVRGSRTGRPIMATLDLLGRRWMLRVLWELRDGAVGFRALQARCGDLSPTVLNTRLAELRAAGLAERDESRRHRLTPLGDELLASLAPLRIWSERWAEATRPGPEYAAPGGDER